MRALSDKFPYWKSQLVVLVFVALGYGFMYALALYLPGWRFPPANPHAPEALGVLLGSVISFLTAFVWLPGPGRPQASKPVHMAMLRVLGRLAALGCGCLMGSILTSILGMATGSNQVFSWPGLILGLVVALLMFFHLPKMLTQPRPKPRPAI